MQLWPIFGLLVSHPMKEPVVLGLFCGTKKPDFPVEFMKDFVKELEELERGFDIEGKRSQIRQRDL